MLVTVVPTFPGLINSINPAINVGYASRLFDIAWLYGVSSRHFQTFHRLNGWYLPIVRGVVRGVLRHLCDVPCAGDVCGKAYYG